MPKTSRRLEATRRFVESLDKIKKSSPNHHHAGYNTLYHLKNLLDIHLYHYNDIPRMLIPDVLIVRGYHLADMKRQPMKACLSMNSVSAKFDVGKRKGDGNYSCFPCKQTAHDVWDSTSNYFYSGIRIQPIFSDNSIAETCTQIGNQLERGNRIIGVSFPLKENKSECIRFPFMKWVYEDYSKAMNVLMNPQSLFFNLPKELKKKIFDHCIVGDTSYCLSADLIRDGSIPT